MRPGARLAAAIDCLERVLAGEAAEKVLTTWARKSRYAGSKDRAAIRDHVFDVLRARGSCAALGDATARGLVLGLCALQDLDAPALFAGGAYDPEVLSEAETARWQDRQALRTQAAALWNMPDAAREALQSAHGAAAHDIALALTRRAPVDLRVNLRKADVQSAQEALGADGIVAAPHPASATCLRVTQGARKIRNSAAFSDGLVELQDAGSQALTQAVIAAAGGGKALRVLDYCAGGGGKSLALAAQMDAVIVAHDISPARMRDIPERAARAGVQITCAAPEMLAAEAAFDVVVVDAPCSGSGAWRRTPDAKWAFQSEGLMQMAALQAEVLGRARAHLAPGGILAYATCSLFDAENAQQVARFVAQTPDLSVTSEHTWTPLDGTDGFYLSIMESA